MREVLRRLLWLGPTLVGVTVVAFWAVSQALAPRDAHADLPLFFNPHPRGVRDVAWSTAETVAQGGPGARAAEERLVTLGGAALPHVLPRLDSLSPDGRQRVARALAPLAARMDTAIESTLRRQDSAVEFWSRFWEENFVDFNQVIVKRVVSRYAQRVSPLRRRDLQRLDTFALDEIIAQMNVSETATSERGQLERQRRLFEAAAHVTGKPWVLAPDGKLADARTLNARWQSWWASERRHYVALVGVERLLSPLLQTRYANWVKESVRSKFGVLSTGQPAMLALRERAPVSLSLLLVGLLGGTLLGMLSGAMAALLRPRVARRIEATLGLLLLALPLWMVLSGELPEALPARFALAALLMLLVGAVLISRHQRTASAALLRSPWIRCYRALGLSKGRVALLTLRPSSNVAVSTLAPHTSTLLTAVFVVEFALHIDGLGPTTIAAIAQRELSWVMLVTLATAVFVGLIQVLSDVLLIRLDPARARLSEMGLDG